MKQYINLASIISLLSLSTLFSFDKLNNFEEINNNITSITTACEAQDAPSIFVVEALFANPENPYPVELWQNRDNEQINIFDIAREIKSIANLKEKIFNNTDEAKRTRFFERLSQMEDIADRTLLMESDKWKPHYVNELMKHIIGIRHAGISDLLPTKVDPSNCKDDKSEEHTNQRNFNLNIKNPCDENGQHWTSFSTLAEPSKNGTSVANYMQEHGADIQFIKTWWNNQVSDSWYAGCRAVKVFYANQRTIDPLDYYWSQGGYVAAQEEYSNLWENGQSDDGNLCYPGDTNKEESNAKALTIWHAYVQEILSKTKFYHNNPTDKKVCLIRSNGLAALKANNITNFVKGYIIPSASYDSFALINIYLGGYQSKRMAITESIVPHHRIIHLYPLFNREIDKWDKELLMEEVDVNFIVENYYKNGSLTIDPNDANTAERFVEEYIYYKITTFQNKALKNPFDSYVFDDTEKISLQLEELGVLFADKEKIRLKILAVLPKKLPQENPSNALLDIFIKNQDIITDICPGIVSDYASETEFVALSGPDLPFDYFYNTDEELSNVEKRLNNGESICGFWPDLQNLKQIDNLGGSTGALLYEDSKTGRKFVLKKGASEGHIREEALADLVYGITNQNIPESRLYETPEGPVKVAVYLEDAKSLYNAYYNADEAEQKRLRKAISEGFAMDALLANFDVIGLDMDNGLVKDNGQVFRVDTGASLRYRAMGKLKNDTPDESRKSWNPSPLTLWTLRDPAINCNSALIFADVNIYEVAEKIEELCDFQKTNGFIYENYLDQIPEIKGQVKTRRDSFQKVAVKALEMKAQGLSPQEADIKLREWAEAEDWGPAFE